MGQRVCMDLLFFVVFREKKKSALQRFRKKDSEVAQSCPTLCDPMDSSLHQAPLSMGFSRQEYWSGLPFDMQKINVIS